MSIQQKAYTSKKTGKATIKYYAAVWSAKDKRLLSGPLRLSEKEAKLDEADLIRAIAADKIVTPKNRKATVHDAYKLWHESTKPPVYANSTWRIYEQFYEDYIYDVFESRQISKITPTHIQKYVNIMAEKLAPETVNKIITVLVNIFSFAITPMQAITENPVSGIKRCKVPKKKKTVWDDETISYFLNLNRTRKSSFYAMFCVSLLLGPRPEEVCGLMEVALQSKPVKSLVFDRGYDRWGEETDMKTSGSHRENPIPDELYDIIHKRLIRKKKHRLLNNKWGKNDYLFVGTTGNPIKPDQYARAFKRVLTAHNRELEQYRAEHGKLPEGAMMLPDIPLYGCRTSFATNTMRTCPNAALIAAIMGNSPKTLMQNYAQAELDMQTDLIAGYAGGKLQKNIPGYIIKQEIL